MDMPKKLTVAKNSLMNRNFHYMYFYITEYHIWCGDYQESKLIAIQHWAPKALMFAVNITHRTKTVTLSINKP